MREQIRNLVGRITLWPADGCLKAEMTGRCEGLLKLVVEGEHWLRGEDLNL
jgi:hypothetical protein